MVELDVTIICPSCRQPTPETMPTDCCVFFYECPQCRIVLRPKAGACCVPRWTAENRQFVDRAKPAISGAAETSEFYFVPSSVRKSVCTFVRQLRGPHFSTWA